MRGRLRPRTWGARATVVLGGAFVVLWGVFAVRAVDRNDGALVAPPVPTIAVTPSPAPPDLAATVDAANRAIFPEGVPGSPAGTPVASPGSVLASLVASPVASPVASH